MLNMKFIIDHLPFPRADMSHSEHEPVTLYFGSNLTMKFMLIIYSKTIIFEGA
jgi:hypothetical protein